MVLNVSSQEAASDGGATTETRGCRHHSSISMFDKPLGKLVSNPIPTHRSGHEHPLTSTDCPIDNSEVPKDGLYS